MAGLSITGQMKVSTLQERFLAEFGLTLRIYDGRSFAEGDATLSAVRKKKGSGKGLSVAKNMKVGNLETKFEEEFGLKVQVSGSDDSYLCNNDLTLNAAQQEDDKKLGRKARKAERSDSASDESSEDQSSVADQPVDGEDDLDFDIDFSWGNDPEFSDEDYKYTHTFIFFSLNEEGFNVIEREVQNHDEAHLLSLQREQSAVLMVDFTNIPGGKDLDAVDWGKMFDEWLEKLPREGVGEEVVETLTRHRDEFVDEYLPDNVYAWEKSENYENEVTLIPAMVVAFKSTKAMDVEDELSENQDGMNLVLTSSGGFLRTLAYSLDDDITKIPGWKNILCGMLYFDQNGDGWHVSEMARSVSLEHRPSDRIVSH